jgi:flavin reductase (DIM6/NTAB) family NADH-FMN oxidoreductase RutF
MQNLNNFEKIDVKTLDNAIKAIGDDWMLITAYDKDNNKTNAMTASWGALGVLWNKHVCICFVRPERHTFKLLNEKKELSIAFLDKERRNDYMICGRESGESVDKLKKCGLTTVELDGISVIAEASTILTCKVLYEDDLKKEGFLDESLLSNYASAGYHRAYVCEIIGAYKRA